MEHFSVTESKFVVFSLFALIVIMESKISLQQHCLPKVQSQTGYALVGTEYKTFKAETYPACMMECKKDMECMSLNFHLITGQCDLNRQTKESRPDLYKKRTKSIYSTNIAFRNPKPMKITKKLPGKSCLDILVSGDSIGTGVYSLDPEQTGSPIKAYCDMTTDGGGWTAVKKTVFQTSNPVPHKSCSDYKVISLYNLNDSYIIPQGAAMLDILQKIGFHQIRFRCYKKSVERVVDIMTKNDTAGQQVVRYFTDDKYANTTFPDVCGSFDRLPQDTSVLAQNCNKWGRDLVKNYNVNKWGFFKWEGTRRIGTRPFAIGGSSMHGFGCYNNKKGIRCSCDEDFESPEPYNVNDTWQIYVR